MPTKQFFYSFCGHCSMRNTAFSLLLCLQSVKCLVLNFPTKEIYVKQKCIYIRMVYIDIQLHAGTCQCKTWSCTYFVFQFGFQHFLELYYFNVALKSCGSLISVFTVLTLIETNYSRKKETSPNTGGKFPSSFPFLIFILSPITR